MLRKAESHMTRQQEYELQAEAQIEAARKLRDEEYEREQTRLVHVSFYRWCYGG